MPYALHNSVKVKRCKSVFRYKQRGENTVTTWQRLGNGTEEGQEKEERSKKGEE
jgi:hypothetical protein